MGDRDRGLEASLALTSAVSSWSGRPALLPHSGYILWLFSWLARFLSLLRPHLCLSVALGSIFLSTSGLFHLLKQTLLLQLLQHESLHRVLAHRLRDLLLRE